MISHTKEEEEEPHETFRGEGTPCAGGKRSINVRTAFHECLGGVLRTPYRYPTSVR